MESIEARVEAVRSRQQKQWLWQSLSAGLVVGGVIGWTLAAAGASSLLDSIPGMVIVSMVFGGAILGAITGKVLVWIIPQEVSPSDNE